MYALYEMEENLVAVGPFPDKRSAGWYLSAISTVNASYATPVGYALDVPSADGIAKNRDLHLSVEEPKEWMGNDVISS